MYKKLSLTLSVLLLVGILSSCTQKPIQSDEVIDNKNDHTISDYVPNKEINKIDSENKDSDIDEQKESSNLIKNSANISNKKLYNFLNSFVTYISKNEEIDGQILNYFNIPSDSYISVSDIKWLLPRIGMEPLIQNEVNDIDIILAEDAFADGTLYSIDLQTKDMESSFLSVSLNKDNEFKIDIMEKLVPSYMIKFPTLGDVKIDGEIIPDTFLSKKDSLSKTYKFGSIVEREHVYTYNNDIYGELSVSLVPIVSKEIQDGRYILDNIESSEYLPIIQDLWNNIVSTSVTNNGDISSIRPYFYETFDETKLNTYATDLYKHLDFRQGTIPVMSSIEWTSKSNSYVVGDNGVDICFKYIIKFDSQYSSNLDTSNVVKVGILKIDDKWVIYGAQDDFLDNPLNEFVEYWNEF